MPEIDIKFDLKGPLFAGGAPQEAAKALHETAVELVAEGEGAVKEQLYTGHGLITGYYRRSVHGDMVSNLRGKVHDGGVGAKAKPVVYGAWLEGISSRNEQTRFKGYAMFRNAAQQLQQMAKGILEKHIKRAIQGMGG